jgi:hypothetical protein
MGWYFRRCRICGAKLRIATGEKEYVVNEHRKEHHPFASFIDIYGKNVRIKRGFYNQSKRWLSG